MYLGDKAVGLAIKSNIKYNEFTQQEDLTEYTIDAGQNISLLIIELKIATLISGKRNMAFIMARIENGEIVEIYGNSSNAAGTAWGSVGIWSKSNSTFLNAITKSGNFYTVTPDRAFNGAKFWADTTYQWYAI
jgi:hypothetical protein